MNTHDERRARFLHLRPLAHPQVSDHLLRSRIRKGMPDIACIAAPLTRSQAGKRGKAVLGYVPMFGRRKP